MKPAPTLLAIDQGTTSSRAILFTREGEILQMAQEPFSQHFPADGWVEHDPEEIWASTLRVVKNVLGAGDTPPVAVGITNQRETTLVWDRATGKPVYNAIVWQDRRTAEYCGQLRAEGHDEIVAARTGVLIDPYFSATKLRWILENVPGVRRRAERGELAFGTVDSFLLWRLTGGRVHATDASNAARTMLFDIHRQEWDTELLDLLDIPSSLLPIVLDCAADFGMTDPTVVGVSVPVAGMAGDQQAALVGQACFSPGMLKSTYGTGCFAILNTGNQAMRSSQRLLTTVGYRLQGHTTYALEGSIFIAGAAVQWLRDGLGLLEDAAQTGALAAGLVDNQGVYLVPALTGLGAPHWDPHARGALFGLTRATGPAQLARATLESVAYQSQDLLSAMARDGAELTTLRIDGGMTRNDWLLQFLSDVIALPVERPQVIETTALGAAGLAGLQAGVYASLEDLAGHWRLGRRFEPVMGSADRERLLAGWARAVACTRAFSRVD